MTYSVQLWTGAVALSAKAKRLEPLTDSMWIGRSLRTNGAGGYGPSMNRVRKGELPWLNIDALHCMILDDLLDEFNITGLSEAEKDHLNRVWHRLLPWPDAISGLQRLRERFIVAPLSNGNIALLTNMAKHAGLPWDCILSSELAKALQTGSGGVPNRRRLAGTTTEPSDDGRRTPRRLDRFVSYRI